MAKIKPTRVTFQQILVIGDDKLSCSLAVCFSSSADRVVWYTSSGQNGSEQLRRHVENLAENDWPVTASVEAIDQWPNMKPFHLVCISNQIPLPEIRLLIHQIEETSHEELIIAIGTGGVPLAEFQAESSKPENIVGLNWTEPAHTTFFMEIIANEITKATIPQILSAAGKTQWKKDPFIINGEYGIQDRMMSALIREALFLVKNDYASPSDIDTACRNDGGTYLPFAGNFRYMDLMGTYLYGLVMEELNAELSTDNTVIDILKQMSTAGKVGVEVGEGFYSYSEDDIQDIHQKMSAFSFEMRDLMGKYMER